MLGGEKRDKARGIIGKMDERQKKKKKRKKKGV